MLDAITEHAGVPATAEHALGTSTTTVIALALFSQQVHAVECAQRALRRSRRVVPNMASPRLTRSAADNGHVLSRMNMRTDANCDRLTADRTVVHLGHGIDLRHSSVVAQLVPPIARAHPRPGFVPFG